MKTRKIWGRGGMSYEIRGPRGGVVYRATCSRRPDGRWEFDDGMLAGPLDARTEDEARATFREIAKRSGEAALRWRMQR